MSTVAAAPTSPSAVHEKFSKGPGFVGTLIFIGVLVVGIAYIGWSLSRDLVTLHVTSVLPYFLLGLSLFVALGFEFVNGFHDTANAVATVIYTHTLDPHIAVVWSGFFNFLGVVSSTGIVAFGIISLLPVELILQVGSNAGFAMVFALLVAAILWNLGTWYFGLSASSSHTLIGTVPTTYALNHAITPTQTQDFIAVSRQAADSLNKYVEQSAAIGDPRDDVTDFIRTKEFKPNTMLAMRALINDVGTEMAQFKDLKNVPNDQVRNFRNDMYLTSEALRIMQKSGKPEISTADAATLKNYKGHIDKATRFIPLWVKVAVAIALGLGTMVGWKRIVVTVGEKIGKNHLTYAQGAAAEITAMATIGAADYFGLPVSTTHVLSSGVAGTMAANHSGLQWGTVRNLLMAWVLTLPVAMTLSGFLFWTFRKLF